MKFVSSRELRINPGVVWKKLDQEKDLVFAGSDFWELTVSLVERALLGTELETPKQIGLEFTS
jgi:hypothetical protein